MTKKHDKVTISLKTDDQIDLLKVRAIYEAKFRRTFSMAETVRQMVKEVSTNHAA